MNTIFLGSSDIETSRLIYGCMRITGDGSTAARTNGKSAIRAAVDAGYTHFDHADIYGGGESEKLFGELLREEPGLRERLIITSKCGIRLAGEPTERSPKRYDFSRDYIQGSVDGSLRRLGLDYLDLLLLHRPDYLGDAAEIAALFRTLKEAGKVRHFGVSNFAPSQFALLQAHTDDALLVNQVEINIDNLAALHDGTLDQCQQLRVTPMAWCPLGGVAYPAWGGNMTTDQSAAVLAELSQQSDVYGVAPWVVALAWLLQHPAGICPMVGSTRPSRIREATGALAVDYSREDWYRLLEARQGNAVP